MRRWSALTVVLALAGCGPLKDAFSAHAEVAGTAAGQSLTVERLATLVGRASRIPVRPDVLTGVANVYLDYATLATALGDGRDLRDSALVLASEWPVVAQLKWEHYHERQIANRGHVTPAAADSVYRAGTVRLFQHILIRVPPSALPMVEEQQKKKAEGVLRQAVNKGGASFAQLAKQYSEDQGTKSRGGYLPATPRGQFVPAFDSAAWTLAPGALSGVVRSPFGFHIIRRPPFAEVRDSFRTDLETSRGTRSDSLFFDSLTTARQLKVESSAPARVRQAVPQIVSARTDDRPLATFRGGAFRVRDLARWLLALDPNDVRGVSSATDDQLKQFVRVLAQRDLLLELVDSAGMRLTPEDWGRVRAEHDSSVARLESVLKITPQMLKDSAATPEARVRLAMAHVDGYMDQAVSLGSVAFVPVPPFLAAALRQGEAWSLNEAGIARALERAQAIRGADTTRRAAPAAGGGALKPAAGPPPIAAPDSAGKRPH